MMFKNYPFTLEAAVTLIRKPIARSFTIKNMLRVLMYAVFPALFFYGASLVVMQANGFEIMQIIRDPGQQLQYHGFLGFLSNIGIWLWISAAAISFFAVLTGEYTRNDKRRQLLILTLILSLMLGMDDLFMIHDLYIKEKYCYLTYALFAGYMGIRYYKPILKIEGIAFVLMICLFGLSVVIDKIQMLVPVSYNVTQVMEEGSKFIGMASWLYFVFRVAAYKPGPEPEKSPVT